MKMIIISQYFGEKKVIENATFIPRISEKIQMGYTPCPEVKDVLYDFDKDEVYVIVA